MIDQRYSTVGCTRLKVQLESTQVEYAELRGVLREYKRGASEKHHGWKRDKNVVDVHELSGIC